ncbi:UDP-N-acetylmuramoylalanine--D-glutamate ligase [Agaricicola taiwanensis]|uniref:UDP-N-acetylmuramoylalanine--D-glutamate ligase n=1 Tax=Agaricicola taiwanensis TaxID=591372 RepID=A0A8J2YGX7_9RHOB|nr:UDP-N-acetylmuramoyl-L-alanine--D-glutamate ligase [Agaricicola taiwanensis]GGE42322.1 UDP-N-acetylmuramoylalanine--D-glutamate ligase [Agaricicola taiwanensis]
MTPATTFKGRRVALFGLGGSGLATAKSLVAGGADVVAWDDAPGRVEQAAAAGIPTADLKTADWDSFSSLLLSPGVPLTHPAPHWTVGKARAAGIEVIGDIEIMLRERRAHAPHAPLVAITGTNGKSTTTALIAHILSAAGRQVALGGNIGTPALELDPPAPSRVHVIEMSSYQIDLAPSLDPTVGVMLNLSEDHLDRHGDMDRYASIKERLVAGVGREGTAVVGIDDSRTAMIADRLPRHGIRVMRISSRNPVLDGVYAEGAQLIAASGGAARPLALLGGIGTLRGEHNAQNAAAASAAALALGLTPQAIAKGLATFPGLAHRMEEVARDGHVLFINDSKATNADAAARALASFSDIFWIAGGKPKTGGIESLTGFFPRIRKAYLIGETAEAFAATLEGAHVPHAICGTLDRAVAAAADDAAGEPLPEAVVLLSPACASFDQFPNFEVRGDTFRDLVNDRIAASGQERALP